MALAREPIASVGEDREIVAGLLHGLAVLKAFGKAQHLTQSELSAATGLTRATARRSLLTLMSLGYVEADGPSYRLTPKVIEFAAGYLNANDGWIAVASPYLEGLRNRLEENVSAVVLDRSDVVYVASFAADTVMSINVRIGGRKPAYCTAMGRVLLAALPDDCARDVLAMSATESRTGTTQTDVERIMAEIGRVREQGYAAIDQELEPGLVAVAVPLTNLRGQTVAAINICGHTMQTSLDRLISTCLPEAIATARRINGHIP